MRQSRDRSRKDRGGFTLLEVLIALTILAVSLMILVSTQSSAARMTVEADNILIGTMLAKQKLTDMELFLDEEEGFSEQDRIQDDGDFEENFPHQYPEFRWRSEIRKLDVSGTNTSGFADLVGLGDQTEESEDIPGLPEPADLGAMLPMDQISEQLARFIREVRVTVYWGEGSGQDDVTLVSHVIKPSGPQFVDDTTEEEADSSTSSSGSGTGSTSTGGSKK